MKTKNMVVSENNGWLAIAKKVASLQWLGISNEWKLFSIRLVLSAFICVHLWIQVPSSAAQTLTGIDVLEAQKFAPLAGKRVGLITNQTGIDRHGRSTIDLLAHAPSVKLVALFSPEHGIRGTLDANVDSSKDV